MNHTIKTPSMKKPYDADRIKDFLKDLQGLCFEHKVSFNLNSKVARLTDAKNIVLSNMVAEPDGCQTDVSDDNHIGLNKRAKRIATGKYQ